VAELRRLIRAHDVSLVHSHKYKCTACALAAVPGLGVPLVATYHNWVVGDRKMAAYATLDKLLARFCAANVAVSGEVRAELQRFLGKRTVHLIANGVDLSRWNSPISREQARASLNLPPGRVAGYVGRLSEEKCIDALIDSLAELPRDVRALIVGDGPERTNLTARAAQRGLADRVSFTGTLADPRTAYAAMDVMVLPSRVEAMPMVLLEAMAGAVPVVATRIGDIPKLVEHGRTGWLLESSAPSALVAVLREVLNQPERLSAVGSAGRALVAERYSAERMAASYVDIYRAVLRPADARAAQI
jgi:glycosyltransferase involved in cell wall biosynthesis